MTGAPDIHRIAFRKLTSGDQAAFEAHLIGLDDASRRSRFGMAATDAFLAQYAERCLTLNAIIHGAFDAERLIGVAELRPVVDLAGGDAEIAFSVSEDWRNQGIGTTLFARALRSARNRGYRRLYMTCIAQNAPMQALARKFAAEIMVDFDEYIGVLEPPRATIISLLLEAIDDASTLSVMSFLANRIPGLRQRRA